MPSTTPAPKTSNFNELMRQLEIGHIEGAHDILQNMDAGFAGSLELNSSEVTQWMTALDEVCEKRENRMLPWGFDRFTLPRDLPMVYINVHSDDELTRTSKALEKVLSHYVSGIDTEELARHNELAPAGDNPEWDGHPIDHVLAPILFMEQLDETGASEPMVGLNGDLTFEWVPSQTSFDPNTGMLTNAKVELAPHGPAPSLKLGQAVHIVARLTAQVVDGKLVEIRLLGDGVEIDVCFCSF